VEQFLLMQPLVMKGANVGLAKEGRASSIKEQPGMTELKKGNYSWESFIFLSHLSYEFHLSKVQGPGCNQMQSINASQVFDTHRDLNLRFKARSSSCWCARVEKQCHTPKHGCDRHGMSGYAEKGDWYLALYPYNGQDNDLLLLYSFSTLLVCIEVHLFIV
jgi:hypothetical protein